MIMNSCHVEHQSNARPSTQVAGRMQVEGSRARRRRSYVCGSVMPFGEDSMHEFKGHRNLAVEELPPWCFVPGTKRRSRRAVSRTLNAFLNTGRGGIAYLGVLNDGVVKGLTLTQHQVDHVRVTLSDLMNRYRPPVPKSRYKLCFVPVVGERGEEEMPPLMTSGDISSANSSSCSDGEENGMRWKAHLVRSPAYCWCDKEAISFYNKGILMQEYVIEITILPFTPNPSLDPRILQLHPIFEDEEERCYFRCTSSNYVYTHQEIADVTVQQVRAHFEPIIEKLRLEQRAYYQLLQSSERS